MPLYTVASISKYRCWPSLNTSHLVFDCIFQNFTSTIRTRLTKTLQLQGRKNRCTIYCILHCSTLYNTYYMMYCRFALEMQVADFLSVHWMDARRIAFCNLFLCKLESERKNVVISAKREIHSHISIHSPDPANVHIICG